MGTSQDASLDESQSANQLVEQIMSSSLESDHAPRMAESAKKKFWQSPAVAFGGLILVTALTVWNVIRLSAIPQGFNPQEAGTYVNIVTTATAIESFADSVGRLPSSLSQLHVDPTGLSYAVDGTAYTLSTVVDGRSVTHRRGVPLFPLDKGFDVLDMKGSR